MKETDVAFFSSLLGEKTEDVERYAEEGTLSDKVKALNLMDSQQVETLKVNLAKEVKQSHISELVEDAKNGNLDKNLYGVIRGTTLEVTEKELAKEYGIGEYSGINDLVSKAISKHKGQSDDTKVQELTQKIAALQDANINLVKEKDEVTNSVKTEYERKILSRDKDDIVNHIPFDFSDVEQADLNKISNQRKQIVSSVFDARYDLAFEDDKVVVKDKEGKTRQDPATMEPIPPSDVIKEIPVELGIKLVSPETGGQGGQSSGGNGSTPFKNKTEFAEWCDKNKVHPTSKEALKVWAERRPQ